MKEILFLITIYNFTLVSSSFEKSQTVDDFGVMKLYHRCLNNPNEDNFSILRKEVEEYYQQSPCKCIKLSNKYQRDWPFKVIVWEILMSDSVIYSGDQLSLLNQIIGKIWDRLLNFCNFKDERKFKSEKKILCCWIKFAEKIASGLPTDIINLEISGNNLSDRISIIKFLATNISINFVDKKIDYNHLFGTLNTIIAGIKNPSFDPRTLSKLSALLWIYILHIRDTICMDIFNYPQNYKAILAYLILKFTQAYYLGFVGMEKYSEDLKLHLKELFMSPLFDHTPIEIFFEERLSQERDLQRARGFRRMTGTEKFYDLKTPFPFKIWEISALAEIEALLIKKGWKFSKNRKFQKHSI
jgi:hypothetical protein